MGGGPKRSTDVLGLCFWCAVTPVVRKAEVDFLCNWVRSSTNLATLIASSSVLGCLTLTSNQISSHSPAIKKTDQVVFW